MRIREGVLLSTYTTLRIGGPARYFAEGDTVEDLLEGLVLARDKNLLIFILGGGSNVLFADRGFDGVIIRPLTSGRKILEETDQYVRVRVGAGEVLDSLIAWTVDNHWWGLENLSYIPGLSGALAMQNVGAYGQEASGVIESVEVLDLVNQEAKIINREACGFTYRHSIFNTSQKGRYLILALDLRLGKIGVPNLSYKDVANYFPNRAPSQSELREAIIEIRRGKGQDPVNFKSAGSFFSNFKLDGPEFSVLLSKIESGFDGEKARELRDLVDKIKAPSDGGLIKVPAAWILDQLLGLKGASVGGAKLSERQVLNIVNTGEATAADCMELFKKARGIVYTKTGLLLVNEPELVGFAKDELDHYFAL